MLHALRWYPVAARGIARRRVVSDAFSSTRAASALRRITLLIRVIQDVSVTYTVTIPLLSRAWLSALIASAEAVFVADRHCRARRRRAAFGGWRAACTVLRTDRRSARSVVLAWAVCAEVRRRLQQLCCAR